MRLLRTTHTTITAARIASKAYQPAMTQSLLQWPAFRDIDQSSEGCQKPCKRVCCLSGKARPCRICLSMAMVLQASLVERIPRLCWRSIGGMRTHDQIYLLGRHELQNSFLEILWEFAEAWLLTRIRSINIEHRRLLILNVVLYLSPTKTLQAFFSVVNFAGHFHFCMAHLDRCVVDLSEVCSELPT